MIAGSRLSPTRWRAPLALALTISVGALLPSIGSTLDAQAGPPTVERLRLYIFDLGFIPVSDASQWFDEPMEVAADVCCIVPGHLIVHPKGTLIWDAGVVPDALLGADGPVAAQGGRPLAEQLEEIGYTANDITYVALSHYHFDHIANANAFKNATWIVQEAERDTMFAGEPVSGVAPGPAERYNELKSSKTIILSNVDEYDVFGDGTVVIKAAPGHTPGHQVLVLNLPERGPVMLAGDLYHFPEERAAPEVVPVISFDREQSRATRLRIEEYVRRHSMSLWISHDAHLYRTLKKSPGFVE